MPLSHIGSSIGFNRTNIGFPTFATITVDFDLSDASFVLDDGGVAAAEGDVIVLSFNIGSGSANDVSLTGTGWTRLEDETAGGTRAIVYVKTVGAGETSTTWTATYSHPAGNAEQPRLHLFRGITEAGLKAHDASILDAPPSNAFRYDIDGTDVWSDVGGTIATLTTAQREYMLDLDLSSDYIQSSPITGSYLYFEFPELVDIDDMTLSWTGLGGGNGIGLDWSADPAAMNAWTPTGAARPPGGGGPLFSGVPFALGLAGVRSLRFTFYAGFGSVSIQINSLFFNGTLNGSYWAVAPSVDGGAAVGDYLLSIFLGDGPNADSYGTTTDISPAQDDVWDQISASDGRATTVVSRALAGAGPTGDTTSARTTHTSGGEHFGAHLLFLGLRPIPRVKHLSRGDAPARVVKHGSRASAPARVVTYQ